LRLSPELSDRMMYGSTLRAIKPLSEKNLLNRNCVKSNAHT
jgi:hypothetical protein